jgi:hypothetical protein
MFIVVSSSRTAPIKAAASVTTPLLFVMTFSFSVLDSTVPCPYVRETL